VEKTSMSSTEDFYMNVYLNGAHIVGKCALL